MLEQIRARHELRVVTLNLPTSYYLGSQGTEGLEFELARSFAAKLGVTLSMYPVANERAMQAALASGRADIAAAQLTATPEWRHAGVAAEPYAHIPQLVVYQRESSKPRSTLQLEKAKLARSRRKSAGADPGAASKDGRPDSEMDRDGADERGSARGRRFRKCGLRDYRRARVLVRASTSIRTCT